MKRTLAILAAVLLSIVAMAQNSSKMTYEEFRSWMKNSKPNGFSFVDSEQSNGDYTASFMQLNKMVNVKLSSSGFEAYKSDKSYDGTASYNLKGTKAVFMNGSNFSVMYIYSAKLNSTIVIYTSYCKLDKPTMEKFASDMGLGSKF